MVVAVPLILALSESPVTIPVAELLGAGVTETLQGFLGAHVDYIYSQIRNCTIQSGDPVCIPQLME
jgi:hypothetical protein